MARYLLAIDQGTTGSTALVMGRDGKSVATCTRELPQHYPKPGWVEHDPVEIQRTVADSVRGAMSVAGVDGAEIAAVGITNQRETTLLWERATGRPLGRAIVWQDRRTQDRCEELRAAGHQELVRERTGLVLDPYFSATKLAWLLDSDSETRRRAGRGELCFGTVDSYLLWWLTGGAKGERKHCIEVSNASRTSLMDLVKCDWDEELCRLFDVPVEVLPKIVPTAGQLGVTRGFAPLPDGVPITGIAGDQQAALFGQGCLAAGDVKCTYGTGGFIVTNTGHQRVHSDHGLLSTVAWQLSGETTYALEGSCFVAGAAVQWLRDGLGIIQSAGEVEALARSVESSEGVVFVPALSGLGAPHWDSAARGLICGLTRGSRSAHIARATLEAIALQMNDLVDAMRNDMAGLFGDAAAASLPRMRVDGGAAANDLLMQLQSDVSRLVVERPPELESTARGAALLAGVGAGWFGPREASALVDREWSFFSSMSEPDREQLLSTWNAAIGRARSERAS